MPKEIADYLNKMGARIPKIKPGKATIDYLTKIQASTRFWGKKLPTCYLDILQYACYSSASLCLPKKYAGGVLLSLLATTSILLDHYLRSINEGFPIGFTSVLIIVSPLWW